MKTLKFINESVSQKEHNDLMHNAYYAVEVISDSLRRANALVALKEIYALGKISEEVYIDGLIEIVKSEGYKVN